MLCLSQLHQFNRIITIGSLLCDENLQKYIQICVSSGFFLNTHTYRHQIERSTLVGVVVVLFNFKRQQTSSMKKRFFITFALSILYHHRCVINVHQIWVFIRENKKKKRVFSHTRKRICRKN